MIHMDIVVWYLRIIYDTRELHVLLSIRHQYLYNNEPYDTRKSVDPGRRFY